MDRSLFLRIASQVVSGNAGRTSVAKLSIKHFRDGDRRIVAIEQNPATQTKWARMAANGHKVVQFRDNDGYIAVSVDGKLIEY